MLKRCTPLFVVGLVLTLSLPAFAGGVETSYHGQMGLGTGLGMLEKWCALPNFSFDQQGGIAGWTTQNCNGCHIGAAWNPTKSTANCVTCHNTATPTAAASPTVANCMTCHKKDTEKRGDIFTPDTDVHLAAGMVCQDCHVRMTDPAGVSDHQFARGTSLDTSEPTVKGTMSCLSGGCHPAQPHPGTTDRATSLNAHLDKVACETCHTARSRPGAALGSRQWNVFTAAGTPLSTMRAPGWKPVYKWYDNTGAGAAGYFELPILGVAERRAAPGAKIYPFNPITVTWFVQKKRSRFDEVIPVPAVKLADTNRDGTTSVAEMQKVYKQATLKTADMNFIISHSVRPAAEALFCHDCHNAQTPYLDWKALGYTSDPRY